MNLSNRGRWLIDRHFDDGLTSAEFAELEQLLQDDPEAAALFVRLARLDAALRDELATDRDAAALEEIFRREEEAVSLPAIPPIPPPVQSPPTPAVWNAWSTLVPTGVLVAAAALVAVALFFPRTEEAPPSAKVVNGKITIDGKPALEVPVDRLFAVAGREIAALQLADGSRMYIQPESVAMLHRPEGEIRQRVELQRGQATFAVQKAAGSFRVETAVMRLLVAGTEFSVRVIPAVVSGERRSPERAEVNVVSGRVVVNIDGEPVILNGGQRRLFPPEEPQRPRPKVREGEERKDKPLEPRRVERDPPKKEEPRRESPRKEAEPKRETPRRDGERPSGQRVPPKPSK